MHKPTDSVRVVLFNARQLELFCVVAEADDPDNLKLPGGKFETGKDGIESPVHAAKRELKEEVGLDDKMVDLQQAETLLNEDGVSARYIFAGKVDANLVNPSAEIADTFWYTEESLPDCENRGHILAAVASAREKVKYLT